MILVMGSEGCLGQFVVRSLGAERISSVRVSRTKMEGVCYGDLRDKTFLKSIFSEHNFDVVIHCSSCWNGFNQNFDILENNISVTSSMLCTVPDTVRKIIYISSSGVYNAEVLTEDSSPLTPASSYGMSKLVSEQMVQARCRESDISYTILRPFHIVNPLERYSPGKSHITTDFLYRIRSNKTIDPVDLDDEKLINITWVGDIVKGIMLCLREIGNNEIFNIGSYNWVSARNVYFELMQQLGSRDRDYVNSRLNPELSSKPFQKIKEITGWTPSCDFSCCISNFLKWGK